jgi:plastocyanin
MHSAVRRALTVGIALVLVAGAFNLIRDAQALPTHSVARPDGGQTVTITVSDVFSFSPNAIDVTPGEPITFDIEQLGATLHTFTLSNTTNFTFPTGDQTSDLLTYFAAHPPMVNLTLPPGAGQTYTQTVPAPPVGSYEYVCEEAGHFAAGMYGFLGVGVNVGPPPGPPIPWGVYYIAGGVTILVVSAIVAGFVVGKREGSKYEMPPERLGYPEPADTPASGPADAPKPPTGGH